MEPLSKQLRKLLREAAAEAYRRELDLALEPLHAAFEQWRRGEISGLELSDRIHRFHQGPNRELYLRYGDSEPRFAVAGAIRSGVMRLEELDSRLLPAMAPLVETIRSIASGD